MTTQGQPNIIAHRGASFYRPENTLEALEEAVAMGADMAELDVRRTGDGVLVVHHDAEAGGRPLAGMGLDEARAACAAAGRPLATLSEAADLLAGRMPLNVELKEEGCERDVVAILGRRWAPGDLLLSSSLDEVVMVLEGLKKQGGGFRTGLIVGWRSGPALVRELLPSWRIRATGADVLCADRRLVRWGLLNRVEGTPVLVYTVNERKDLWKLITGGRVAGIFTDRPDVALFLRDLWRVRKEGGEG